MEPQEVDTFHGRWSEAAPDQAGFRIAPAPPSRAHEMIALTLDRLPRLTRAEVAWPFEKPEIFDGLVIEEALDRHDRLLGWGLTGRPAHLPRDRTHLRIVVAREHEGRGVGRALFQALGSRNPDGATMMRASVDDDDERSHSVALRWGFRAAAHTITSELDLGLLPVPDPPEGVTLDDVPNLEFADRAEVEAMLLRSQTNPEAASGLVLDLAGLAATVTETERPVGVVARVDGRPAAITFGSVAHDCLHILYSGVDPALRGRGLMRLVKQQAHLLARDLGATVSRTTNAESNGGIRRVNAELGYAVVGGTLGLVKPLA
jgi:GNAT superfamily N-acetyltransferase